MKTTRIHSDFAWFTILAATCLLAGVAFVLCCAGCQQPVKPAKPAAPKVAPIPPAPPNSKEDVDAANARRAKLAADAEKSPTLAIPEFGANGPPMGYTPNPKGTGEFLRTLDKPTIREAGPDLFPAPTRGPPEAKKGVLLYRPFREVYAKTYGHEWECGTQGIGDCVSWGWMHGIAIATAVEYSLGNISEWKQPATEAIYGGSRVEALGKSRAGRSDGSYGGAAAKWVNKRGGILFREKYERFDLTKYSAQRAKDWGDYGCGGQGDNGWADELAKQHPVHYVALVTSFTEAAAAIDSGYPVPVCSGQGFASTRDKDGFSRPSGSWSHCMCFIATRYEPRPGLLCLNSWGPRWVSGPKWPDDQPDGSFWVDAATATRMLAGEDSFAVSAVEGFPFRPLDNGDWVQRSMRQGIGQDQIQYALAP